MFFDSHGNQNYYTGDSRVDFRGQPLIEIYDNTFHAYDTYRLLYIRGGSLIIYNNTMINDRGTISAIALTEEEDWQTAFFSPLKTTWPAQDQISNSFFWNNTLNGQPVTDVVLWNANDPIFIQQGRDYWMHAPAATGGKTSYTDRPGGNMTFTATGPNAYYPYTPLVYPHPLITAQDGPGTTPPAPPANLRIR